MSDHHQYCTGGFAPDDIVISGISGRFPQCSSLEELKEALLAKKNLVIQTDDRFEKGADDFPFSSTGTLNDLDKFDSGYFGYSSKTADQTDPLHRMILEVSYEAIADSGYDPAEELKGANVGVYTAISNDDGKELITRQGITLTTFGTGYLRAMGANRCSYHFGFVGPSFTMDAACSSSFVALWSAYNDVKQGRVDAALVNAGQLCLTPSLGKTFMNLDMLSLTCESNPFDARANGIVKTEAVTAFFIQKASSARRAYATIMHVKHGAGGHDADGFYVPSFSEEVRVCSEVLKETGLDPKQFQYVEAHGSCTQLGDSIELKALEVAYCQGREEPLYIGSVKSNLGLAEAPSGQVGAIKALFAFESGLIPPNYGYESPNPNCVALVRGAMKVVTEPIPLTAEYIPVNNLGLGGSVLQTVFRKNPIEYPTMSATEDLPRLVLYPASSESAVHFVFEYIKSHPELRSEFFALLNKLSFTTTALKPFRGYALFQSKDPVIHVQNSLRGKKPQLWFIMNGLGCQWSGMGLEMMRIKVFADSMQNSAAVLKPLGVDLFQILKKDSEEHNVMSTFVTIAAIQIALIDVLRVLDIHPDGVVGHSIGELICAYVDGCCTAEQVILMAYWRGKIMDSGNLKHGLMAAVGLTRDQAVQKCPKDVYIGCQNAEDLVTVSGLKEPVERFIAELQKENIFARMVDSCGYAIHSQHVYPVSADMKKVLTSIIPDPKPRTERWISTTYQEKEWDKVDCKMAGPEYFVHNLMSTVLFNEACKRIPSNAITIEIGPHFLLQSVLKRTVGSDATYIGLMERNSDNNIGFFLESLGKLYTEGLNPKIENIYNPVKFPVPRNTPMICDLIKWNHSQPFYVPKWGHASATHLQEFNIETTDRYLLDHVIDGRSVFPSTGYVWLAWQALAKKIQKKVEDMNVVIEDFKVHRSLILRPKKITFYVIIMDNSGRFEITEGDSSVASGVIYEDEDIVFSEPNPTINKDSYTCVPGEDIYKELRIEGYEYGPAFRRLLEMSFDGKEGFVEWKGNWITFMEALFLFDMFTQDKANLVLPSGALRFKISPKALMAGVEESLREGLPGMPVNFTEDTKTCRAIGIEIQKIEFDSVPQQIKSDNCVFEEYKFIPYAHKYVQHNNDCSLEKYMIACNTVIGLLESTFKKDLKKGRFCTEQRTDFDILRYIDNLGNDNKLLSALKEMQFTKEQDGREVIFNQYVQDIGKEFANTLLINEYCMRFMFDIIAENSHMPLNVLEMSQSSSSILPAVVNFVEKRSLLKIKNKTLVCNDSDNIDKNTINACNIKVHSYSSIKSVAQDGSQNVVISSICVSTEEEARKHIKIISSYVQEKGFILLLHKNRSLPPETLLAFLTGRELSFVPQAVIEKLIEEENLVIAGKISDDVCGCMYLLKHRAEPKSRKIIQVSDNLSWLNELKKSISEKTETCWVVSEDAPDSGVIGTINCVRKEPGGDKIRCAFIPEKKKLKNLPTQFNLVDPFYKNLLAKDLAMNVYKDGYWGSFRHIRIEKELQKTEVGNSCVNIRRYGDLSSLVWMESALDYMEIPDREYANIYYSGLSTKDVLLATGKISPEKAHATLGIDNCVFGCEFSGRTRSGERIAGLCKARGLSTATQFIPELSVIVPDKWSLEEAATVPLAYATCYYGLVMRANLERGESILIHSGADGVGLAAISIALSMNCEIFTTVDTEQKKKYLLEKFPDLKDENIGCSSDTTFENMIATKTKGKGVNVVLNSLADEMFYASVRCLSQHGNFVEIGKYPLAMDNKMGLKFFLKNISFHAISLDKLLTGEDQSSERRQLRQLLAEGIRGGVVRPLDHTVFHRDDVEKAFRCMADSNYVGKVILKIREEEKRKSFVPTDFSLPAVPATYFYPHKVYIVVGGLNGFGMEVSKWLLEKGAKNLVLTSRQESRTPCHEFNLQRWKGKGYNVIVSTKDVSIKEEASKFLKEVSKIGPVGGIFNAEVIPHDAFLENTNTEVFRKVIASKVDTTKYLDVLSRSLCPELDHFVCFSSFNSGRGNPGKVSDGYACSTTERICERRRTDGFPGLAIQWGKIGDVGVTHSQMDDDTTTTELSPQKVKSCLNILDVSCQLKRPVVCTYVVKDSSSNIDYVLQQIARTLGFKEVSELSATLSFAEVSQQDRLLEAKLLLESTLDITFTMKEMQQLKISDLRELLEKFEVEKKKNLSKPVVSIARVKLPKSFIHSKAFQRLNDIQSGVPVFVLDIDCGDVLQLKNLAKFFNRPVFALLWSKEIPSTDVVSIASWYLEKIINNSVKEAHIVALSGASVLALEMTLQNQKSGKLSLTLTILNGYSFLEKVARRTTKKVEIDILCDFVENYYPIKREGFRNQLAVLASLPLQIQDVVELLCKNSAEPVDKDKFAEIVTCHVKKQQLLQDYAPEGKLNKDLLIVEDSTKLLMNDISKVNTVISMICSGRITIQRIPDIESFKQDSIPKVVSLLSSVF